MVISISLVPNFGIQGALVGTISALLIGLVLMIQYDNHKILVEQLSINDYKLLLLAALLSVALGMLRKRMTRGISGYLQLIIRAGLILMLVTIVYGSLIAMRRLNKHIDNEINTPSIQ